MRPIDYLICALLIIAIVLLVAVLLGLRRLSRSDTDTGSSFRALGEMLGSNLRAGADNQTEKLLDLDRHMADKLSTMQSQIGQFENRLQGFTAETTQNLENIRGTVSKSLTGLQEDNNKKLDEMRTLVDQKLQKTLSDRMTESFKLVNERLEQVYKGLGEMQALAQGVGDLKKVLTNVKTRGILGEIQLGAILEQILSPEQYDTNVATKKGSSAVVEYAVKLPVESGDTLYLPIDAKFPGDTYAHLRDAYENGSREEIDQCAKQLITTLRAEAKDIHDKYLDPPNTTDFAILFLPFEGLYAEVVNRGMVETLQRDYQVNIAGPSTMAALLNSLQMGFRTFAIQKRSGEVWNVLGAVKTEFGKFSTTLEATQNRLTQASAELDKLVGVRTRQIQRKLNTVTSLSETDSSSILQLSAADEEDDAPSADE